MLYYNEKKGDLFNLEMLQIQLVNQVVEKNLEYIRQLQKEGMTNLEIAKKLMKELK